MHGRFHAGIFSSAPFIGKMFSLTSREQMLLVIVLAATLLGASAKHWRDVRREQLSALAPSPTLGKTPASPRRPVRAQVAPRSSPLPEPQVILAEETATR